MSQPVYKQWQINRATEAWRQLSAEEQAAMFAKLEAALKAVGGKQIVTCACWSTDGVSYFGVEEFPSIPKKQPAIRKGCRASTAVDGAKRWSSLGPSCLRFWKIRAPPWSHIICGTGSASTWRMHRSCWQTCQAILHNPAAMRQATVVAASGSGWSSSPTRTVEPGNPSKRGHHSSRGTVPG